MATRQLPLRPKMKRIECLDCKSAYHEWAKQTALARQTLLRNIHEGMHYHGDEKTLGD